MRSRRDAQPLVRSRIGFAAFFCAAAFSIVGARLVDVMVFGAGHTAVASRADAQLMRADFVDRKGVLIARDLPISDLYAIPTNFWDPGEAARQLSSVTGASEARLAKAFAGGKRHVLVSRGLTPDQRERVMRLGLPGLSFEDSRKRFYPSGRIVSHAVGQVDIDGNGVSGLELGLDRTLRTSPDPVMLSLDMRVQFALQHEIRETALKFQAKAAGGLVMDVNTGEVLALVSLPDYEPNARALGETDSIRNRMTQDVYELGSIFKIFAMAEAFEEGTTRPEDIIDIKPPLMLGRHRVNDFDNHGTSLTAAMVFADSSNIGTARIHMRSGPEKQRTFLSQLGLLTPQKTEVPETARALIPRQWGWVEGATISYGHGISVNPLAFAAAAASMVNGGTMVHPTFLKNAQVQQGERVISEQTSMEMRRLLRLVVTDGTGGKADVPGYEVGGKTGTAEKADGRGYSRKKQISSFVGMFPMSNPKYLVFAMFDEPIGIKESFGFATAGWTAAPTVGKTIARIAPLLGVRRSDILAVAAP